MVVRARPSIRRKIQKSSVLNTAISDWMNAHTLSPIATTDANFIGPTIVEILYTLVYALILVIFIYLVKTLDFSFTMCLAPVFIFSNAMIFVLVYTSFFKDSYTNRAYYSLGIYKTVYIWVLWVLNSIVHSFIANCNVQRCFTSVFIIMYSMLTCFFIDKHFEYKYIERDSKSVFLFRLVTCACSFFFGIIFLAFITLVNLFNFY